MVSLKKSGRFSDRPGTAGGFARGEPSAIHMAGRNIRFELPVRLDFDPLLSSE
jgi:hypothetical protein